MTIKNADIVTLWEEGHYVCFTSNGCVRNDGRAVMGAGSAKAIGDRLPELSRFLGNRILKRGNRVYKLTDRVIAFPTRPKYGTIKDVLPGHEDKIRDSTYVPGYWCKSDIDIIKRSFNQLYSLMMQENIESVYLPLPEGKLTDRLMTILFKFKEHLNKRGKTVYYVKGAG